jgi:signal transduction histidine kinase
MNRGHRRQVLDCASPLALSLRALIFQKRQSAAAVQDAIAPSRTHGGSRSPCAPDLLGLKASHKRGRAKQCGAWPGGTLFGTAIALLLSGLQTIRSQTLNLPPVGARVLTNIYEIWEMPQSLRNEAFRMETEMVIYYFDPEWRVAWGECCGRPSFLPIADSPTPLKAGQRIALDGVIVPTQEKFEWDKTRIRILAGSADTKPEAIQSLTRNAADIKGHLVSVTGLIDHQIEDRTHLTLNLLVDGETASVYVLNSGSGPAPRFKAGDFVRIKCVYSPQFNKNGNLSDLTLWAARPADLEVIGSLTTDPRFALPVTPSERIRDDTPTNDLVCVQGIVRSHEPGKWVTLWDVTGQIMVQSKQTQPLRLGDSIEAIGHPFVLGVQQCLQAGLYRLTTHSIQTASTHTAKPDQTVLRLAERVRDLSREEAARHPLVILHGVLTWYHAETPFVFVQDASGGIRVLNPKWDDLNTTKPGTIVTVRGEVAEGDFVPVVTNAMIRRTGWWNLDEAQAISLEQAMTGVEDGRWAEMRGYVRDATQDNGLVRLDLSTSSGEFQTWTPASQSFAALRGSIVRVQGVCAAISNSRHQLTGIQIWAPEAKYIQVEEPAPDDLFAGPLRSLGSLRRFNLQNALNQRVRTTGTVVLHAPGRYLYLQNGADSVFALSQQSDPLEPGDEVEVVGFPGVQGRRFLLREAAYRRISTGKEPAPARLSSMQSVNVDMEGVLAIAEGTLLNMAEKEGESRLLIRSGDSTFEASLDSTADDSRKQIQALEPGSRLAVTGVYEMQSDEYGKPRSFLLHLRSKNDIRLLQLPPWWTLARLLWVLLGVLGVSVVALTWGLLISHKSKLLKQAQSALQAANDRLELRVQERTHELQEQVAAKERARAELAETQENLVLTSRQAGMAEVATGVLHNVGNVLNSVNISSGLLGERLRRSSIESVGKVADLLRKHHDQLGRFMTEDPKGKALPGYLEKLGEFLVQDKREMQAEVESLVKNVDHIKVIVSMQQSYARVGGVLEELDPKDLAEDAIQINSAALDRDRIQLIRDYHPVPRVMVDRHKVLQILVNLISNAKYALDETTADKKMTMAISAIGSDRVRLTVKDNGIGIPTENLNRIFSQGFTTRKDGHGFGLHSGANAAKELGGSLTVQSEGTGRGTTFILELPTATASPARASVPTPDH